MKYTRTDLLIFGQYAQDCLDDFTPPIYRPGGVFYSALAASALGKSVVVMGSSGEVKNKFYDDLTSKGIQFYQNRGAKYCCQYSIRNANEVFPQVIVNKPKVISLSSINALKHYHTRAVLLYPSGNYNHLLSVAEYVKNDGGLVCFDLQHDISDLSVIDDLIAFCDIFFVSRQEFLKITNCTSEIEAVKNLHAKGAKTVIVKSGLGGSKIYTSKSQSIKIPTYLSNFKCTIGAGDTYNSVFVISQLDHDSLEASEKKAALAASVFCECVDYNQFFVRLKQNDLLKEERKRITVNLSSDDLSKIKVYLAGHFFSAPSKLWVEIIYDMLKAQGFAVFCPHLDAGIITNDSSEDETKNCFTNDINGLRDSKIVLALLDDFGYGGVSWEIGYAYSLQIPVLALLTDKSKSISNMITNSCQSINTSLSGLLNDLYYLSQEIFFQLSKHE